MTVLCFWCRRPGAVTEDDRPAGWVKLTVTPGEFSLRPDRDPHVSYWCPECHGAALAKEQG